VQTALALQGTPYQAGGDSPGTGFDCSGFVHFLFREQGWELPRTVREQFAYGRKIREREIQSGDLLFFATESRGATHVGLAVDPADAPALRSGHPFIHAPGDNGAVRFDALESAYWKPRFLGARRLF
jgi:cell wall-associated NlpC family hydrolase